MGTIRFRFISVALVVSVFAIGMAAFLNYFKYKSTIGGIVKSRVLVIGRGIENSVQASLSLGMPLSDIATLPALLQRERAADRLILGIDVFDDAGQIIYSTEPERVGLKVPPEWTAAAERSKSTEWSADAREEHIAGISLKNNFDLTVGYLAMRYSRDYVDRAASSAGAEILLAALGSFALIALIAPLALVVVIRRFERDLHALDVAASHLEDRDQPDLAADSTFEAAIGQLRNSLRQASGALDDLRTKLDAVS